MGHSRTTLWWGTLVSHPCRTLAWDALVGHSPTMLGWDTLVGHSHGTLSWHTLSCDPLSWDTLVAHASGALLLLPKSHTSSLQNERFVRDILQKSRVKVPKIRAFRQRSGKSHQRQRIRQPCQAASQTQPLKTITADASIQISQRHSPPPNFATSRFPAPATKIQLRYPQHAHFVPATKSDDMSDMFSRDHAHVFSKICAAPRIWNA